MNNREVKADLHIHTTASDGLDTLEDRVIQSKEKNLESIAITDHDTLNSSLSGRNQYIDGIEVISGVEAKADFQGTKIEILGYYVNPESRQLQSLLSKIRDFRHKRNRKIVRNIETELGLRLDYQEMKQQTEGLVARPHFAEKLVENGFSNSISGAFESHLGKGKPCFEPMERIDFVKVLDTIDGADGLTSLAHPGRIRTDKPEEIISRLSKEGMDGIEVWYPYDEGGPGKRSDVGVGKAGELAEKYDLLKTGGSDCHGRGSGKYRIASEGVDKESLQKLRKKAGL